MKPLNTASSSLPSVSITAETRGHGKLVFTRQDPIQQA